MTPQKKTPVALAGAAGASENSESQGKNIPDLSNSIKVAEISRNALISWPSSFILKEDGIYKVKIQDDKPVEAWVFSPLVVKARTCDADGHNWGLLLSVQAPDFRWHDWAMPMQLTGGNGSAYREVLLNLGLRIAPGAQNHLHTYLMTAQPKDTLRCVSSIGWHGQTYVLPDGSFGDDAGKIILQSLALESLFRTRGTLKDWQELIGKYCPGNSRLTFAVCAAIAAPLLRVCGMEGGGVHFLGRAVSANPFFCWWQAAWRAEGETTVFFAAGGQRTTLWNPLLLPTTTRCSALMKLGRFLQMWRLLSVICWRTGKGKPGRQKTA